MSPGCGPLSGRPSATASSLPGVLAVTRSTPTPRSWTCISSACCAGERMRWPPAATMIRRPVCCAGRMRDSLEEERRAAIRERIECELALGRHASLVGELHHLLAQYPLDETFIAHQMIALYRSGRQGDALTLYRETRGRLVEEQGTEPGSALSELHQRILQRDPELAGKPATRQPARISPPQTLPARITRPDTLPPETAEFVGRDEELSQLVGEQGDAPRVSMIVGMPGVGKTALAVHAAHVLAGQYPDGVLYLNFHSHDPGSPSLKAG